MGLDHRTPPDPTSLWTVLGSPMADTLDGGGWWALVDSNHGPHPYQGCAIRTSRTPRPKRILAGNPIRLYAFHQAIRTEEATRGPKTIDSPLRPAPATVNGSGAHAVRTERFRASCLEVAKV